MVRNLDIGARTSTVARQQRWTDARFAAGSDGPFQKGAESARGQEFQRASQRCSEEAFP